MDKDLLAITLPTLAVLIGILVNNSRLTDLRVHMDSRFNDLKAVMDARFETAHAELIRVEQVLDARLKHLEKEAK